MRRTPEKTHSTERATDDASVAAAAERVAVLLEAEGAVARSRIWRQAAAALRASTRPIAEVVADESVEGVHRLGIGYLVSGLLTDLVRTGHLPILDGLERRAAQGRVLQRVPGIGPKLACELRQTLGVESLEGLARAAHDGTLSEVCGFGPRRTRMLARLIPAPKEDEGTERATAQLDLNLSA